MISFGSKLRTEKETDPSVNAFGRGANSWENHTIESYLEAGLTWAEDSKFTAIVDPANNRIIDIERNTPE